MPSEKQIQAAAKAMETLALERGFVPWDEVASVALTAAEQAEPAPAAEPERKWPAFVYDSEAEPNMRTHPTPSEARLREALETDEVLWCETCGERPQEVHTEHAGLCRECWVSEGRPE